MKQKILVTGANGQLGQEIKAASAAFPAYDFIFVGREDLPIQNFELARTTFQAYAPAYLINCAAYTAVDKAETEQDLAYQVNAEAVGVLAAICHEHNAGFIHISTDYVFDGTASTPYKTGDATNPQSVYGASKLQGELQALQFNPESIIIRTSWVYSEFGKNFIKTMLRLMAERKEIGVVNDQWGSPTYAADLAEAILQIIASGKWKPGIYHYSNTGVITWHELATAIKELSGSECIVNPIPSSAYPTPAKRPAYSVLDTSEISNVFGIHLKDWKTSLATALDKLGAGKK